MNAIIMGIIGLIWVTIAVVAVILGYFGGDILAAIIFLAVVFATPFVLDKIADVV